MGNDTGLLCSADWTYQVVEVPSVRRQCCIAHDGGNDTLRAHCKKSAEHLPLPSGNDACESLHLLTVLPTLAPIRIDAPRCTVASRFRRRSCERGYIFPRAPEQFVTSPLCLVGYVRWDARSDRVPPLQTIIFSSFPGRSKGCRPARSLRKF